MASDIESDLELTPSTIMEAANATTLNLVPEISKKKYETAYKLFMNWQKDQKTTSYAENVVLAYFGELSKKYKSPTLWTQYSMLRTTFNIYHNVDIAKYGKLKVFLKRKSRGYKAKKSKTFTTEQINKFITEAPDQQYLLTKTALILGVMGACRRHELYKMETTHLTDMGSAVLVTVPDTKTKIVRNFTVTKNFYEIIKKYWVLRPANANDTSFFLNYQNGKCTVQKVGINKFGAMGKQIATYLQLPNPELYTGHCFRRSSARILVDAGEDITSLKRHGGWKSTTVDESYIDDSLKNKLNIANKIQTSINSTSNIPSTSREKDCQNYEEFIFEETPSKMKIEENWNDSLTVESEESTTCEVPDPIIEVNTENRRFLPPQSTRDILLSQDAQNKRGRVKSDIDSSFGKRLKRASDMLANIASHRAEPVQDSASLYGQLLAIKLRGLSKRTQLVLQNKIDNLVFQAELDEIDSGTCVTPNSVQSP